MQGSFISVVMETWEKFIIQYHLVPHQWNKMVCKEWHYKDKTEVFAHELCKIPAQICRYTSEFEIRFTVLSIGLKKRFESWKVQVSQKHNFDFILLKPREPILYVSEYINITIVHNLVQ